MNVEFKPIEGDDNFGNGQLKMNDAILKVKSISPTEISLIHCNDNDGFYGYKFIVKGTEEEIKIITEFCEKVEKAEIAE